MLSFSIFVAVFIRLNMYSYFLVVLESIKYAKHWELIRYVVIQHARFNTVGAYLLILGIILSNSVAECSVTRVGLLIVG